MLTREVKDNGTYHIFRSNTDGGSSVSGGATVIPRFVCFIFSVLPATSV